MSCSTTVPSITSRVRIRSSRIPFWVMSCQIVSESETGMTPTIASATHGCLESAAQEGEGTGEEGRDEVEEADPEKPDEPVRTASDPSVQGPDLVLGQDREIHLHEVGDKPNAHILVDARAGVLDEVSAEHVHRLAHQVSQADQPQVDTRWPQSSAPGAKPWFRSAVDGVDQACPARWQRPCCRRWPGT